MYYRIYIDTNKGYQHLDNKSSLEELIMVLDHVINLDIDRKVLVIEHNKKENSDFPIFLYTGANIEEYIAFRSNVIGNKKAALKK